MRSTTIKSFGALIGAVLTGAGSLVNAAPPPAGTPDSPPATVAESESNNTFGTRDVMVGSDACRWQGDFFARLGPRDTGHPDTVLGFYDILGRPAPSGEEVGPDVVLDSSPAAAAEALAWRKAESRTDSGERGTFLRNDDGGPYRRWGGSALSFLQEGPFGSNIRVTGKGCDPLDFSGDPCVHGQSGQYEVIVNWFAAGNIFIGRTIYRTTLSNNDLDEFLLNPPATTFDFDVIVKTLADYTGDVDFFQIDGLRANEQYVVSTVGLHARFDRTLDTILGEYNGAGARVGSNDDIGLSGAVPDQWWNRNSRFTIRADGAGRVRVAVTGYNDFDFDGFEDPDDDLEHDEQGSYTLRVAHVCAIGCADANGDCEVNFADITHVLTFFGFTCQ